MILVSARWKLCLLLLCACCCLTLLSVEVHHVPRWWRPWWPRNRAGNSCRFRGGWLACARRWHRRRTWAHNVSGGRLVPTSGVDEADDRDREEEGEEAIGEIDWEAWHRDEMTSAQTHWVVQPLSQTSATHELCTRKMCACVQANVLSTRAPTLYNGTQCQRSTFDENSVFLKKVLSKSWSLHDVYFEHSYVLQLVLFWRRMHHQLWKDHMLKFSKCMLGKQDSVSHETCSSKLMKIHHNCLTGNIFSKFRKRRSERR